VDAKAVSVGVNVDQFRDQPIHVRPAIRQSRHAAIGRPCADKDTPTFRARRFLARRGATGEHERDAGYPEKMFYENHWLQTVVEDHANRAMKIEKFAHP
jgi:hypothetical protein